MKTIAQFVKDGISTLGDLQEALQLAMQLEFATIPPYLCAEWSSDSTQDPGGVAGMIENIVIQEMFHFALAGNMLSAIAGTPDIANSSFVPKYPTNVLPGGIPQKLPVDLQPLSINQLQVFMQIEYPEFPPVALTASNPPATIGAFYDTIATGFVKVNPAINPGAHFVNMDEA
ncbi:MAG: ferritin-like domain-containing protein, partial [Candidatus Sulfotelmatobacter sp.]